MNRTVKNYNKIIEVLSSLTKQAELSQKSIAPMTKMVEEIQKPLHSLPYLKLFFGFARLYHDAKILVTFCVILL